MAKRYFIYRQIDIRFRFNIVTATAAAKRTDYDKQKKTAQSLIYAVIEKLIEYFYIAMGRVGGAFCSLPGTGVT